MIVIGICDRRLLLFVAACCGLLRDDGFIQRIKVRLCLYSSSVVCEEGLGCEHVNLPGAAVLTQLVPLAVLHALGIRFLQVPGGSFKFLFLEACLVTGLVDSTYVW